LPAVPVYCRCALSDLVPFFRKPVSSTTKIAVGVPELLGHRAQQFVADGIRVPARYAD
jgi:hypothetical protein